jgi:hypothetical protein
VISYLLIESGLPSMRARSPAVIESGTPQLRKNVRTPRLERFSSGMAEDRSSISSDERWNGSLSGTDSSQQGRRPGD